MNRLCIHGALLLASTLPSLASADFDDKSKFLCAAIDVSECLPGRGCQRVGADDIDIPRFFNVDVKGKTITTTSATDKRKTSIERIEDVDGKLILQGAEDGREDVDRDGVGWTMSVTRDRGDMVLTVSGEGAAFVVFGSCIKP